ncbi:MAG: inositol monophosphatase [Acidimicrobiia bacterium]|nr:inositol monophosphatase [Acidimicrobiia bacterium]
MGTSRGISMNFDGHLSIALEAVDLAVDLFTSSATGRLTAKGERDYASEVDYAIEDRIRSFLQTRTPEIGFVGEEDGASGPSADLYWLLDPIDGTVNYTHALPMCGISLALVAGAQPQLGVIDHPYLSTRYTAVRGSGAHCNGKAVHVSTVEQLADALVTIGDYAVGEGAESKNEARLKVTAVLAPKVLRLRMLGAAAVDLAWLADGRTDASLALSNNAWDMAAGAIIASEAGATVSDLDGSHHTTTSGATIAANPRLHGPLLDALHSALSTTS